MAIDRGGIFTQRSIFAAARHATPTAGTFISVLRRRLKASTAAEPVVALVLPVAAEIFVGYGEFHHVLGVLEAELGGHAHLHRESEFARQDLAIEAEGHLRLRVQRGGHVD